MHLAVRHASLNAVKKCREFGGDLNALAENYTNLHLAVHNQDPEKLDIIFYLVYEANMDVEAKRVS